jgi:hypothetical protein
VVALTRSSRPEPSLRAWLSILLGAFAVAAVPAAIVVTQRSESLELVDAAYGIPFALVAGVAAILLGTRARRRSAFTLGRVGGSTTGLIGRWLGLLGVYVGLTAALAVGFYGLLTLFD